MNDAHHHFIDEETGQIFDIPWDAIEVKPNGNLGEYDIHAYQVVMRGRRKKKTS